MRDQTARDTIFALSSGTLPSGVAIVRLSGPATGRALEAVAGSLPPPREARLRAIRDLDGALLDRGIVLFFPAPESVTGEDCGELHVHGGRAVVSAMLQALASIEGLRAAEAGEFTRRAFVNGKMDLTDVEALSDLIAAETEAQRRFAVANADGRHRALYEGWRARLIQARALVEAELDFADESDVPGSVAERVWADMRALAEEIGAHAASYRVGEIAREGFRVVILGAPNAGKSSLLNALANRDVAIVTDEPGTTRDSLEVALDLDGVKVIVTDTAGIRDAPGRVEALGIERAMARAGEADLLLLLEDVSAPVAVSGPADVPAMRVGSKTDLCPSGCVDERLTMGISVKSGAGLDRLVGAIGDRARAALPAAGEVVPFRLRHVALLQDAIGHLEHAVLDGPALELRAEEMRLAGDAIGRIAGAVDAEELLDVIFSQFCIGK